MKTVKFIHGHKAPMPLKFMFGLFFSSNAISGILFRFYALCWTFENAGQLLAPEHLVCAYDQITILCFHENLNYIFVCAVLHNVHRKNCTS